MQCDCINLAASVRFYVRFVWKSMPVSPNTRAILQNCWVANICLFGMLQSLALLSANASAFAGWKVEMWQTILRKVQNGKKRFQKSWKIAKKKYFQRFKNGKKYFRKVEIWREKNYRKIEILQILLDWDFLFQGVWMTQFWHIVKGTQVQREIKQYCHVKMVNWVMLGKFKRRDIVQEN